MNVDKELQRRGVGSHGFAPNRGHDTRADSTISPTVREVAEHAMVMITGQLTSHLPVDQEMPEELHRIAQRIS